MDPLTRFVLRSLAKYSDSVPVVENDAIVLRYPKPMLVCLACGLVFFAAVAAGLSWPLLSGAADEGAVRHAAVGVPFVGLFFAAALCEMRVHLVVDDVGIRGRTAFRGQRAIAWADLAAVRWSQGGYLFLLLDKHGRRLRVSAWLQGHAIVPAMLEKHVPKRVWNEAFHNWQRRRKAL